MKKRYIFLMLCYLIAITQGNVYSQITFGSEDDPDPDAVLDLQSSGKKGLLLPRLKLVSLNDPAPLTQHTAGMVVYNTGENVPVGYYFNDGFQWVLITDTQVASWKEVGTNEGASGNTQNIYQTGDVSVGVSDIDLMTKFSVSSDSKGFMFPRLTTQQINELTATPPIGAPDGLTVYNLSTQCFNYYHGKNQKWVSLCPEPEPSAISIDVCTGGGYYPQTPEAYKALEPLTSSHFYRLKVRVNNPGAYTIRINTNNGYSFEKSGTFTETGEYTLDLPGQGVPSKKADPGDDLIILLNGEDITASLTCTLPVIPVAAADIEYTIDCSALGEAQGKYLKDEMIDRNTHYIDVDVNIVIAGKGIIETNTLNGILFRSDLLELADTGSSQTIRLYGLGTPDELGTFTFSFPGTTSTCTFDVVVDTELGTFDKPAKNCFALYEEGLREDKEYWIQQSSGSTTAVKTLCDMTNGGFTLVWSFSERTIRERYTPVGEMTLYGGGYYLSADKPFNVVTTESGTINYFNHRLAKTTMNNVKQDIATASEYRVRIAYDPSDVNDAWGKENYFHVKPVVAADLLVSTGGFDSHAYSAIYVPTTGKLFGLDYDQATNGTTVTYAGTSTVGASAFYYSTNSYGNHWDAGFRIQPDQNKSATVTTHNNGQITINVNSIHLNNIFTSISEDDINHHIGKCIPTYATDATTVEDYSDANMRCTYTLKRPHSFNPNPSDGQYEGRVVQWWVK